MRSWTPKALRISLSASKLHHAPLKRTFHIKKHITDRFKDAATYSARYKDGSLRLVKEVKQFSPSRLPIAKDTTVDQDEQPQDLIRKIILGADKDDNIAAYEQRHQKFFDVLKGKGDSGEAETVAGDGINRVERAPNVERSREKSATEGIKELHEKQDNEPQIRHRKSFFSQIEALSASSRFSGNGRQTPGNVGETKSSNNVFFDAQAPADSEPMSSIRPNAWSRTTLKNHKAQEESLGSKPATVKEVRPTGSYEPQVPFKRLSLGISDDRDGRPMDNKASYVSTKRHEDGSELPLAIHKDIEGAARRLNLSPRAVQRSEFESAGVLDASGTTTREKKPSKKVRKPKTSLFEELFPEEATKHTTDEKDIKPQYSTIPRLSLPVLDEDESFGNEYMRGGIADNDKAISASQEAFQSWNLSVLVLQVVSPSLIDSDFRRVAPKGQHISEWTGPGDYFKVIPGRDPKTLTQLSHYFLIFPSPAYARTYQSHLHRLHRLARTHTPTSIFSPPSPPCGMLLQGEDVHALLQDYALCPPSQKLSLVHLSPPLSAELKRLLRNHGYPELTQPVDRTGRCVLFWVEGYVPSLAQVQGLVMRDGRLRGMAWGLLDGREAIQQLDPSSTSSKDSDDDDDTDETLDTDAEQRAAMEDGGQGKEGEAPGDRQPSSDDRQAFRDYARRTRIRWTIAFEDENEPRRFVRRWHLRPFPEADKERGRRGDHAPVVHAEFMW